MKVPETGRIHIKENALIFENAQEIDSGNYTFVVNNTAGQKTKIVWVIISGRYFLF